MLYKSNKLNEEGWKLAQNKDKKLRELAIKAGVENDYEKAKELLYNSFACKSDAASRFVMHLFCIEDHNYRRGSRFDI